MRNKRLRDIVDEDPRYDLPAYEFVLEALTYTQDISSPQKRHVTGQELLEGIKELGIRSFGPLAGKVFETWGVHDTIDFGNIVFNLVENGLMGKREDDSREDFRNGFDIDSVFWEEYKDAPLFRRRR